MALKKSSLLDIYLNSDKNIDHTTTYNNKPSPISDKQLSEQYAPNDTYKLREIGNDYSSKRSGVSFGLDYGTLTKRILENEIRINKFIKDNPAWALKKYGEYAMNPKVESVTPIVQTRLFNLAKFEQSILLNPFGSYSEIHGQLGNDGDYETIHRQLDKTGKNRLVDLYNELGIDNQNNISTTHDNTIGDKLNSFIESNVSKLASNNKLLGNISDKLNLFKSKIKTLSGIGGQKSLYGVGFTNLYRYNKDGNSVKLSYTDSQGIKHIFPRKSPDYTYLDDIKKIGSRIEKIYTQIYKELQPGFSGDNNPVTSKVIGDYNTFQSIDKLKSNKWGDFQSKTTKKQIDKFKNVYSAEYLAKYGYSNKQDYYNNWNYAKRLKMPNADKFIDDINMGGNNVEDFVKLKIGGIQFRCTMTGLSDSFSPDWASEKYVGRPDEVYTYNGIKRTISFGFIVYANSDKEMDGIYSKLNKLAQLVSPKISNGLMNGQLITLKLGMWLAQNASVGIPVILTSLNYSVSDDTSWDVFRELPQGVTVDVSFDIIGNRMPSSNTIYFGNSNANVS